MIPDMDSPVLDDDYIVGGALRILDAMMWMRWDLKAEALEGFYHGMRGTCSGWVKTSDRMAH